MILDVVTRPNVRFKGLGLHNQAYDVQCSLFRLPLNKLPLLICSDGLTILMLLNIVLVNDLFLLIERIEFRRELQCCYGHNRESNL